MLWIHKLKQKQHPLFVQPNDPWFIHIDDITLDQVIKEYNHVTIYDATWRRFQRVCVKRIDIDQELIRRELDILSMCAHPSVCQFLGISQDARFVYFVFEFMENGNLEEYIQRRGDFNKTQRLEMLLDIARGLQYLSSRQPICIIHRDFKPSNILINKHGDAKISDFGISKYLKNNNRRNYATELMSAGSLQKLYELSQNNAIDIVGTVRWTAPEVLCDNKYNHLCDIFSFGLVAYFVWTHGEVPYDQEYNNHGAKIAYAKNNNVRPFLVTFHVEDPIDRHIYDLIRDCTEKDIRIRPQSAEEIVERLVNVLKQIIDYEG